MCCLFDATKSTFLAEENILRCPRGRSAGVSTIVNTFLLLSQLAGDDDDDDDESSRNASTFDCEISHVATKLLSSFAMINFGDMNQFVEYI